MLKIRYNNRQQDPFWIMERSYAIGSADDNHLVLSASSVAPHHIKIIRDSESIVLKALDPDFTTLVNGHPVLKSRQINCGDTLSLGEVELEIIDPLEDTKSPNYWSLIGDSSWLSGQEFPLIFNNDKPVLLGRGKHCDIVFPGTHLSREHAAIFLEKQGLLLEDLKSANATFVNDERVTQKQLKAGDRVRFDVYSFRVFGPGIELHKSATRKIKAAPQTKPRSAVRKTASRKNPATNSTQHRIKQRQSAALAFKNSQLMSVKRTPLTNWLLALLLITLITSITAHVLLGSSF